MSLQEGASRCHTLDRRNILAQRDCGAGAKSSTFKYWVEAAELEFNMTYWPQLQDPTTAACIR